LRDHLGAIYKDEQFTALFPHVGQPAYAPWRLALISVLQFLEGLSDRQAADAVRGRIDWKYLLGLELTDAGFDHTVLPEFRSHLLKGQSEQLLFETWVTQLHEQGYLKERGRQRSDSTHILAMVHAKSRVECVGETFRHTLNTLAVVAPEWCLAHLEPEWTLRYDHRVEDYRLPKGEEARLALALIIGTDGKTLLDAVYAADAPGWLAEIPAVETLRRVWIQNYSWEDGKQCWRSKEDLPPAARFISSPYESSRCLQQEAYATVGRIQGTLYGNLRR
jgi:transposase